MLVGKQLLMTTPAFDSAVDPEIAVRLRIVFSRLARQLNLSAAAIGLSPTQLAIFTAIARHGPVGLGRLAEAESVNTSMLSRVVAKLESAGIVERLTDPDDGRAFLVSVSPEGRRLHLEIKKEKTRWLRERLEELEPDRARQLLAALPALEDLAAVLRVQAG